MERFILWGLITLIIALLLAGGIFFYIQNQLSPLSQQTAPTTKDVAPEADEGSSADTATPQSPPPLSQTLTEPIPLSELPLSDTQRSLFEAAGVDVDTYEITPEAVACAEEKIGADRVRAIMEGDSLSFTEGIALSSCL